MLPEDLNYCESPSFPISQVAICSQYEFRHIVTFLMQSIHSASLSPSSQGGFVDIVSKEKLCKLCFKVSQRRCVFTI